MAHSGSHHEAHLWETDKNFGVVHMADCNICTSYIHHITAALSDKQPSFCKALEDLENQQESHSFSAGIVEGRRLQRARDADELNEAREKLAVLHSRLQAAQAECESLKQHFEDVEPGREVEIPVTEVPSDRYLRGVVRGTGEPTHDSLHDTRDALDSPDLTWDRIPTASAVPDTPSLMGLSIANDVHDDPWAYHGTPIDYPSSSPTVPTSYIASSEASDLAPLPQLRPQQTSSAVQSARQSEGEESNELPPQERFDTDGNSSTAPVDSQSVERRGSVQTGRRHKPLKSIKEANMFMNMAHQPGNVAALWKVKRLLRAAQETKKGERTVGQKHLIAEWRSVEWDDGSYPPWKPSPQTPAADTSEGHA